MSEVIFILPILFVLQNSKDVQNAVDLARKASNDLINSVRSVLLEEINKSGYLGAIKVCSTLSQRIVKSYQEKYNIYIRRVSEKYRNEANKPDSYELKILKILDDMNKQNKLPDEYFEIAEESGEKYLRYFKPVVVQPLCLGCHGSSEFIKPEVGAELKRIYPADKATGYQVGDLRGAVSVKIKLDPGPKGGNTQ